MTQRSKFCVERMLPADMTGPQEIVRRPAESRAITRRGKLWMIGSVLRVLFMGGTPVEQTVARQQAEWWAQVANLRFDFNNAPDAELRIAFDTDECAWSYIGTDAKGIPLDQPTMNLGFVDGGIAAHEFGHAIGLVHQRQNPEGGKQWNETVMIRDLSGPPMYWTAEQIRRFMLTMNTDSMFGTFFDPDSIMNFFYPPEWTQNGVGTMANTALSSMDKALIAKMYPHQKR
jgi:hypothetical protein